MQKFRYLTGVTSLQLDGDKCIGCGQCGLVCPHGVLTVNDQKAEIVDLDGCMECGACTVNCPTDAIQVTPGVGCAAYIISSWINGKANASCCGDSCG